MAHLHRLLNAMDYLESLGPHRINLSQQTMRGGGEDDDDAVCCPLGWLIRNPAFKTDDFCINDAGEIAFSNGQRADAYLYAAVLFDMSYLLAQTLFQPRSDGPWDSFQVPELPHWTDWEVLRRRLEVFYVSGNPARRSRTGKVYWVPERCWSLRPGIYVFDAHLHAFDLIPGVPSVSQADVMSRTPLQVGLVNTTRRLGAA